MSELVKTLGDLRERFRAALDAAPDMGALEMVRIAFLGRKGEVTR
jgi:hypothetical protein